MASPLQIEITKTLKLFGFEDSGEVLPHGGGASLVITEQTVERLTGMIGATVTVTDSGKIEIRMS